VTVDGVEGVLRQLEGKVVMGLVTTSKRPHFEIMHRKTGLLKYFDFFVTLEDCARSKPHPDPYLMGTKLAGCDASECIAVEDSVRGLRSAMAAKLDCVVMPGGFTANCDFSGAARIVKTPEELLGYLTKLI
jgi:HAD superfamily hydrolase (TIGR01509 family)